MLSARDFRFVFSLVSATFLSLMFVRLASAQCDYNPFGFQGAAVEPANPFQAEYSTTGMLRNFAGISAGTRPLAVARDSQGRVRTDNSAGMYKAKSSGAQETEIERHIIWICDPVSKNSIQMDTGDKTATIQRALPRPPRLPALPVVDDQQSFCARLFDSRKKLRFSRTEDLGHQIIEGFDAVGLREWPGSHRPASAEMRPASSSYKDMWCSDQLGAVILQSHVIAGVKLSNKSDTMMQKFSESSPTHRFFRFLPITRSWNVSSREGRYSVPRCRR